MSWILPVVVGVLGLAREDAAARRERLQADFERDEDVRRLVEREAQRRGKSPIVMAVHDWFENGGYAMGPHTLLPYARKWVDAGFTDTWEIHDWYRSGVLEPRIARHMKLSGFSPRDMRLKYSALHAQSIPGEVQRKLRWAESLGVAAMLSSYVAYNGVVKSHVDAADSIQAYLWEVWPDDFGYLLFLIPGHPAYGNSWHSARIKERREGRTLASTLYSVFFDAMMGDPLRSLEHFVMHEPAEVDEIISGQQGKVVPLDVRRYYDVHRQLTGGTARSLEELVELLEYAGLGTDYWSQYLAIDVGSPPHIFWGNARHTMPQALIYPYRDRRRGLRASFNEIRFEGWEPQQAVLAWDQNSVLVWDAEANPGLPELGVDPVPRYRVEPRTPWDGVLELRFNMEHGALPSVIAEIESLEMRWDPIGDKYMDLLDRWYELTEVDSSRLAQPGYGVVIAPKMESRYEEWAADNLPSYQDSNGVPAFITGPRPK